MQKNVFISRDLSPDSIFQKMLNTRGLEVSGQSLIEFSAVPFELPEKADWLFFYSQNGVRFFFENAQAGILPKAKTAAIGPATAEVVRAYSRQVDFVGDGASKTTAAAFLKMAAGQRVVFPRAANSRRSIQKVLGEKIAAIDLVVYQNLPKKKVELPGFDVLVFTSPMNAQAYFSEKKWREGQRVIAIGRTTEKALHELGIKKVEVADEPSERGLAIVVLSTP